MAGVWQVPPRGLIWKGGRWMREEGGWYRVPGFWSPRRGAPNPGAPDTVSNKPAWRTTGPPADHPADTTAMAPGPEYFFVAGHYEPAGDQLIWKVGFWAREQPGWDWVSARWVRRAGGWEFRAGHWEREPGAVDLKVTIDGRPAVPGAAVPAEPRPSDPNPDVDLPPPLPSAEDDVIAGGERRSRRSLRPRTTVIVPGPGMPYVVIRPPGSYPYGPGGVVVPAAVPPFVRRILDQVLP
jgi:hypothetical protein